MMFVSYCGEVIYMILDCFTMWKALEEDIKEQALSPQILSGNSILSASQKNTSISSQDLTDLKRQCTYSQVQSP